MATLSIFKGWVAPRLGFPSTFPLAEHWLPIKGFASFLISRHHDPSALPRSRTPPEYDLHVPVKRGQKIHYSGAPPLRSWFMPLRPIPANFRDERWVFSCSSLSVC